MGTFRARFTLTGVTGTSTPLGAGNDASHFTPVGNTGSFTANYAILGSNFFLDGSGTGIDFSALPPGFTLIGNQTLTTPNRLASDGTWVGSCASFEGAGESTNGTLTYGIYGPITILNPPAVFPNDSFVITNIPFTNAISLTSPLAITITNVYNGVDINGGSTCDIIDITGSYGIAFTATLGKTTIITGGTPPPLAGTTVKIRSTYPTSGQMDLSKLIIDGTGLYLTWGITTYFIPTIDIISFTPVEFVFLIPELIPYPEPPADPYDSGDPDYTPVTVHVTGNGTQFSGSVSLGILALLIATGSGIYQLVKDKTSDTLYDGEGNTFDVKIPDPFIKTAFIGSND